MRAKIVKINDKTIVIKNSSNKFLTVPKNELSFDYELGDTIEIEKNGDEYYFLPYKEKSHKKASIDDFWEEGDDSDDDHEVRTVKKKQNKVYGVGGWLTLYIIVVIAFILVKIARIPQEYAVTDCSPYRFDSDTYSTCQQLQPLIGLEIAAIIAYIIFKIYALSALFQKKKKAIKLNIISTAALATWTLIDGAIALSLFASILLPGAFSEYSGQVCATIVALSLHAFIWVAYFKKSKRVKNTLVEE